MNKKISVIVPVYKVEDYIERCIDSLLNQTSIDFELILVDDCGGDRSSPMAEKLLTNSNLEYKIIYRKQNGGLSAARNTGIAEATGEYLYFVDSDDALPLNAIERLLHNIAISSNANIMYHNASYWHNERKEFMLFSDKAPKRTLDATDFLSDFLNGKYLAYIWMYLFKRTLFDAVRFPEGAVYEDALTVPLLLSAADTILVTIDEPLYLYYPREGSISRSFHPQLYEVMASFDKMERTVFSRSNRGYLDFVNFRTTYLMRLSREAFTRADKHKEAIRLHKYWNKSIPSTHIGVLWRNQKRKSALFIFLLKMNPHLISTFYKLKLLK